MMAAPSTELVVTQRRMRPDQRRSQKRPPVVLGRAWWALPALILILLVHYIAVSVGAFFAFTDWSGLGSFNIIGLENFVTISQTPEMLGAVRNTLFLAFGVVILQNALGLALALMINRGLKSRYLLRAVFFLPVVLSELATGFIWRFLLDYNGPINQLLGALGLTSLQKVWLADPVYSMWAILFVVVWQGTGLAMIIYLAGLANVPVELEEAAAIDGANLWQRFWHVTLPALRPALAISTTLGIVHSLAIFDQVLALTGGGPFGSTDTLATLVYSYGIAQGQFGLGSALALVLTVIILIFALLQQYVTRDRSAPRG